LVFSFILVFETSCYLNNFIIRKNTVPHYSLIDIYFDNSVSSLCSVMFLRIIIHRLVSETVIFYKLILKDKEKSVISAAFLFTVLY
jgi:hypothetical protein